MERSFKLSSLFGALLVFIALIGSTTDVTAQKNYKTQVSEINPQGVMGSKRGGNVIIIDIRRDDEVVYGIIPGARHIDFQSDDFREKLNKIERNSTIIVYCQSGGRSTKAISEFVSLGFEKVYNLTGGYSAFIAAYPPESFK